MAEHVPLQGPARLRSPLPSDDDREHEPGRVIGHCVGCGVELRTSGWLRAGNVSQGASPEPRYTQWQQCDEYGCQFGPRVLVCSTCEVVVRQRFPGAA